MTLPYISFSSLSGKYLAFSDLDFKTSCIASSCLILVFLVNLKFSIGPPTVFLSPMFQKSVILDCILLCCFSLNLFLLLAISSLFKTSAAYPVSASSCKISIIKFSSVLSTGNLAQESVSLSSSIAFLSNSSSSELTAVSPHSVM